MSVYSDLILAESALQSYWRLDETVGSGTIADSKGAITGTVLANTTLGTTGLIASDPGNTCVLVSQSNPSGITCGDNYPFAGTANFSVEAWIKPDAAALAQNAFILYKLDSATDGWTFRILAAGGVRISRIATSVVQQAQSATGLIVADNAYHVVATYNGTTLLFYVDGLQVATGGSTQSLLDTTSNLTIGAVTNGSGQRCSGSIDEVAIYNDDLSAASVLEHYEIGIESGPTLLASDDPPFGFSGRGAGW